MIESLDYPAVMTLDDVRYFRELGLGHKIDIGLKIGALELINEQQYGDRHASKNRIITAPQSMSRQARERGSAGIVSEHDQKYVRSTCLRCWQKVVIAWKKGDYLKDKECPLCGGRLLGKVPVKKGDPDIPVLEATQRRATDFHCVALTGTNPFEFVSSAHELVRP